MIKNHAFFVTILVVTVTFIFYSWNIVSAFTFYNDPARDLVEIHEILEGDMRLIGPNASFGGLKTGPYYYYLFAPILFLTKGSVEAFLYFNAFIFSVAVGFFFWTIIKKFSLSYGLLGLLAVVISPLFIFAARNPGNANTYVGVLLTVLTLLSFYKLTNRNLIIIGFLMGIIVNFQYANIVVFIALTIYLLFILKRKKMILYYLLPFIITFVPLVLFEIRHDFVMTKNTLFSGSYKGFIENTQLEGKAGATRNIFENIFFISENIKPLVGVNPLYIFIGLALYLWKFSKKNWELSFTLFTFGVFFLSVIALQFQFALHYVFPASVCILFMVLLFAIKGKRLVLIGFVIILELSFFPQIFDDSKLPYWFYKDIVKETISKNIVKHPESFNIIQIRPETATTPLGYEYRYFFILNGIKPLDVQKYNESQQLVIFSRVNDFNLSKLDTWEIQQFGKQTVEKVKKINIRGVDVYSIVK